MTIDFPVPNLTRAALGYAERGWLVIPLHTPTADGCSCGKSDCKVGKHPRTARGLKEGSRDPARIREWWTRWPDANIGIVTGPESGIFVLDVDGRRGEESLIELERCYAPLPATYTVRTGGSGLHFYFLCSKSADVRNSQSRIAPGVDIRGDGGYVVAPPSLHASGRWYVEKAAILPALCPEWLLSRIQAPPKAQKRQSAPTAGTGATGPNSETSRTNHLVSLAGSMNRRGFDPAAIEAALVVQNKAKFSSSPKGPLPEVKVREIAHDIPSRYVNSERFDILDAAMERLPDFSNIREGFRSLCIVLQRLRGDEAVVLPVGRIAEAFGCHHTLISRLRLDAVAAGWLKPERKAIAHRQAARFHVLSDTGLVRQSIETPVSHENEKEDVVRGCRPLPHLRFPSSETAGTARPSVEPDWVNAIFSLGFDPSNLAGSLVRKELLNDGMHFPYGFNSGANADADTISPHSNVKAYPAATLRGSAH